MNPTYDDIRVGDTVHYTGTESRDLIDAIGVVRLVGDSSSSDWVVCESGPLSIGAFARNLTVVMRPVKPSCEPEPTPDLKPGDRVQLDNSHFWYDPARGDTGTITSIDECYINILTDGGHEQVETLDGTHITLLSSAPNPIRDKITALTQERDDLNNQVLELEDKQFRLNGQIQTLTVALEILEQTS